MHRLPLLPLLPLLLFSFQEEEDNRKRLDENFNGTQGLAKSLRVDLSNGLAAGQVSKRVGVGGMGGWVVGSTSRRSRRV